MKVPAVFLDRDGTIIEDTGYVDSPEKVRLLPGAAEAVKRLSAAGFRIVLVSNQSGVARGILNEGTLQRVHERVAALLGAAGAQLDAYYYCPFLDGAEAVVENYRKDSDLRKPRPGMLLKAAKEHDLELALSWMIGDSPGDVEAGRRAGCKTILIAPNGRMPASGSASPDHSVANLSEAAAVVEATVTDPTGGVGRNPRGDGEGGALALMAKIAERLDTRLRDERQHDFSMLRFGGSLLQMLSIVAAAWGAIGLLNDHPSTAARLLFACYLQLAAVSAFLLDRPK